MAKKKILFLGQLPPPVHGVSIINSWILQSSAISNYYTLEPINLATAKSIADIGKQGIKKYLKFFQILWLTLFRLIRSKYAFFYITLSPVGSAFLKDSLLVLLARAFKNKIVIHLHGKGIANKLSSGPIWLVKYYNYIFKNAFVIVLAETLKEDIAPIKSHRKIFVLPNGVPEATYLEKGTGSKISVLHLSNMIESKGSLDLLEAVNTLKKNGATNFKVNFVGNWGSEAFKDKFLSYLQANQLEQFAEYLGPLYQQEKQNILQKSQIFALPTYYANECFPLTILEAMNAGLAVISTNEGAIPEIINDQKNGFIVAAHSPDELANQLEYLINNQSVLRDLGKNAQEEFYSKYAFPIFENNLLNIFNMVAN
jgi:glycosyltransferase involved in cell wall biosynthesis